MKSNKRRIINSIIAFAFVFGTSILATNNLDVLKSVPIKVSADTNFQKDTITYDNQMDFVMAKETTATTSEQITTTTEDITTPDQTDFTTEQTTTPEQTSFTAETTTTPEPTVTTTTTTTTTTAPISDYVDINAKIITSVSGAIKHIKIEMPVQDIYFGINVTVNYDTSKYELIDTPKSSIETSSSNDDNGTIKFSGAYIFSDENANYILEADFKVLDQDNQSDFDISVTRFVEYTDVEQQKGNDRNTNLNISYETEKNYILGDINFDGQIDIDDAVLILRYEAGQISKFGRKDEWDFDHDGVNSTMQDYLYIADINGDGLIDIDDAILILRYEVGEITVLKRKETVSSIVVDDDGNPITDVSVKIVDNSTNKLITTQTTDTSGKFLYKVREGNYTISFEKNGYTAVERSITIDGYLDTIPLDETITMKKSNIDDIKSLVSGTVIDTEGNPISGVDIKANLDTVATTDEDGNFEFDILEGEYQLSFEKDEYQTYTTTITANGDNIL